MVGFRPVRVVSVSSECAPLAKTGGLADVCAALPRALRALGHDPLLYLPYYRSLRRQNLPTSPLPGLSDRTVQLGPRTVRFAVLAARLPGDELPVHLVDCPEFFDRDGLYGSEPDEQLRFAALCHAALIATHQLGQRPDVFHAHDWQAALLPLLVRSSYAWSHVVARVPTLLTIHNLNYQGQLPLERAGSLGLPHDVLPLIHEAQHPAGFVNLLLSGIAHADAVSTVSPTYAEEIQTPEFGAGLDSVLRARRERLVGILNGADPGWDPSNDALIEATYDAQSLERKAINRRTLLQETGLAPAEREVAVFGIVSRLASQKGFDLLQDCLPRLLSQADARVVILGSGEPRYEQFFAQLQAQHQGRVCFYRGFHERLAHRIEAGADIFLMPSRYEPCGLNQMYSLLYGTVPVVRAVGGLADTVRPWNRSTGHGNGFLFGPFEPEALWRALVECLRTYDHPEEWRRLQRNGMAADFSWSHQAARYVALYQRLAG